MATISRTVIINDNPSTQSETEALIQEFGEPQKIKRYKPCIISEITGSITYMGIEEVTYYWYQE